MVSDSPGLAGCKAWIPRWIGTCLALAVTLMACEHSAADHTHAFTGHVEGDQLEPAPEPAPGAEPEPQVVCGPVPDPLPSGCEAVCTEGAWALGPRVDAPPERCNGEDDDCDGSVDESLTSLCCLGEREAPCNGLSEGVVPEGWSYVPADGPFDEMLVLRHELTRALWRRYAGGVEAPGEPADDDVPVGSVDLFTALAMANSVAAALPRGEPCYLTAAGVPITLTDLPELREGTAGPIELRTQCAGPRLPTRTEFGRLGTVGWDETPVDDCGRCPAAICGRAWCACNAQGDVKPVGLLAADRLGLYDMAGNLAEWVWPDGITEVAGPDVAWPVAGGSVSGDRALACSEQGMPPISEALRAWDAVRGTYLFTGIRLVWAIEPGER